MFKIIYVFVLCFVFANANTAALHVPTKCDIKDVECKKLMYQNIYREAAIGIPDLNVPQVEPLILKKVVTTFLNSIKLTMKDVKITGFKYCEFDKMQTYLEGPLHTTFNLTCNIVMNSKAALEFPKSAMKEITGEDIATDLACGSGEVEIAIEKLHLYLDIPFSIKRINDEIYLLATNMHIYHDAPDKINLFIKKLDIGNDVCNKKISSYLEEKSAELDVFCPVTDKILEFFEAYTKNYLSKVPTKTLYTTNLSSYV